MAAKTWDTSRTGGGTYEFTQDAQGNYTLGSVGFDKLNKLNLPELKAEATTTAADTKKTTATASAQTAKAFGNVQPFYYNQKGEGDTGTQYTMRKEGDLSTETKPIQTQASIQQRAQIVDDYGTSSGGNGSSDKDNPAGGCVVATHAVNAGVFDLSTKREAIRWCVKNLHRTWWGEAIRRGYRYYGQKAIDQGTVKKHYQEFKNYLAFATGKKRNLKNTWTFLYRTIQFFIKGITI